MQHWRDGAQDCILRLGRWFQAQVPQVPPHREGGPGVSPSATAEVQEGWQHRYGDFFNFQKEDTNPTTQFPSLRTDLGLAGFPRRDSGQTRSGSGKPNAQGREASENILGTASLRPPTPPNPTPPGRPPGRCARGRGGRPRDRGAPGGRGLRGGPEAVPRPAAPPVRGRGGEKPDLRRLSRERGCRGARGGGGTAERFPPSAGDTPHGRGD